LIDGIGEGNTGSTIERMGFLGSGYNSLCGLRIRGKWQSIVRDCMFNTFDGTASNAISVLGIPGTANVTTLIDRCRIRDSTTGVLVDQVTSTTISHSYIANCKTHVDAANGNGDSLLVSLCEIDGGTVSAATAISCNLEGSRIIGNRFEMDSDDICVSFGTDADNSAVIGNWFYGASKGVVVPDGCYNTEIIGNTYQSTTTYVDSSEDLTVILDAYHGYKPPVWIRTSALDLANQPSSIIYFNSATGFGVTLPSPAIPKKFKFIVKTVATTNDHNIYTASSANIIQPRGLWHNAGASVITTADSDTVKFMGSTALVGDWVEFESDGTNWYVTGYSGANGGIAVSAT